MNPISPRTVHSIDADIFYWSQGTGPALVLLHPFPVNHKFWMPAAEELAARYRVLLPDLRGHGQSDAGEGPATMEKHAADVARVLDDAGVPRAVFAGVSIGGYLLFEFWRRHRGRVVALALSNTKAPADGPEARNARVAAANEVIERGTAAFFDGMIQKVLGTSTRENRPDLVEEAKHMMNEMSPQDVAAVQRGMAARMDSVETLKTIDVPTLLLTGDEDLLTGVNEAELMRCHLRNSEMKVIPKAGHYAPWEQQAEGTRLLRQFVDRAHAK